MCNPVCPWVRTKQEGKRWWPGIQRWQSQMASHSGRTEAGPCIFALRAKLLLNPEKLIVLGKTLTAARCTGLDLPRPESNHKVGNERILCLTRTVGDHHAPAIRLRHIGCFNGLSD